MSMFEHLAQAIVCMIIIYILAISLRHRKVLHDEHSLVLAKIVTELCLPAIVFINLAKITFTTEQLYPALLMLAAEIGCIALAWLICIALKLPKEIKGPIVFCSAFGSSTFLGYAIIMQLYPHTPEAMTQAVLISEIGVGYPIFILGPILGAYFGKSDFKLSDSLAFFKSPVFFAFILGLLWHPLGLPTDDNRYIAPLFSVCHILSNAITPLAIISVGLMFKIPTLRTIITPLLIVISIKLFLKPLSLGVAADALSYTKEDKDILVLLAAMPSAVLGAVFLRRYGGNAALASTLLLATTILSCGSILLVFWLVG